MLQTLRVSILLFRPQPAKAVLGWVASQQSAAVGGYHLRLNRSGLVRRSRSPLTEVQQIRMSKLLRNRTAVLFSMVVTGSLILPATTKAKPLPHYQHRTARSVDESTFQSQGKVRPLARYIQARYAVPAQKASTIVSEALRSGSQQGLDPKLILAVIAVESTFKERAVSRRGARGLMQVKADAHHGKVKAIGGTHALFNTGKNIHTGSKILANYLDDHHGNLRRALLNYSGSRKNSRSSYPDKVLHVYRDLKQAHR
jgi:flagellum-specific peptidoglycan hydrolase FlgJ